MQFVIIRNVEFCIPRSAAVDPVIGAAIIGAGATLLASSGGGGGYSTTVYQLNTGDLINADQCWQVISETKTI